MDAINKPAHYNQGSIECIDAMQIVLTPEEYRGFLKGNAIKYLWREENKGGIEDLRKAKWYLDRLIEHCDESLLDADKGLVKAWTCENGKAKQVYPEQPQLPDGWRWLEVGEVIRKGDSYWYGARWYDFDCSIGEQLVTDMWPSIRRNRFEVGEKVVHVDDKEPIPYEIDEYIYSKDAYTVKYKDGHYMYHWSKLAPYIEETT